MQKLTITQALEIQAAQCAHYEQFCPGITQLVQDATDTSKFDLHTEYSVVEINRYVPRGGAIERLAGLCDGGDN